MEWNYEGALLSRTASGDTGPGRVIERPKVIYNKKTSKYVLWMHIDSSNYGEAKIGVATGDTVCGKYKYLRSERPLGFESRDSGTYVDDDGNGYLLTEDVRMQSNPQPPYSMSSKLTMTAPQRSPHQPIIRRLPHCLQERLHMEREVRSTCLDQEERRLLYVQLSAQWLGPQRQLLQHRHLPLRTLVGLEEVRRL